MARPQRLVHTWSRLIAWSLALLLAGCGGGGSGGGGAVATFPASPASLSDSNVAALLVEQGPGDNVNIPYVSVTVCAPGTNTCKTIDHVLVDTGSIGLRLFASQLAQSPALALPAQTIGSSSTISECAQFLNNTAWGTVNLADVVIGAERAPSVPIQVMNASFASLPSTCGSAPLLTSSTDTNPPTNSESLNANGILGVGLFANDGQIYFNCSPPTNTCKLANSSYATSKQVRNPVTLFSSGDSNGVVIQLPTVGSTGVGTAQGYLIFGVGTQGNNVLGSSNVVPVSNQGFFTTAYRGFSYPGSFIDSGSNGLYFTDPSPTVMGSACQMVSTDFYCPTSQQNLTAGIQLQSGSATVSFSIVNAATLFAQSNKYAFSTLGGTMSNGYFDWGLPFFFGRSVYTVIEGHQVNTGSGYLTGPFNAFTN